MKPEWLTVRGSALKERTYMIETLKDLELNTVCHEAACPNMLECFGRKIATFMILGANCTRGCTFCNVTKGKPTSVNKEEPAAVAEAVKRLGLLHVVVTSVTRDDLEDGGAEHFSDTIKMIRKINPKTTIEVLIPDLKADGKSLDIVINAKPDVIGHNVETVPSLYKKILHGSDYQRSLNVLKYIKEKSPNILTKTGIMLGLGEEKEEVLKVLQDIRDVGCDFLTVGQYLAPTTKHQKMVRYIEPDEFAEYETLGYKIGFKHIASGPLVRSSYHADEAIGMAMMKNEIKN